MNWVDPNPEQGTTRPNFNKRTARKDHLKEGEGCLCSFVALTIAVRVIKGLLGYKKMRHWILNMPINCFILSAWANLKSQLTVWKSLNTVIMWKPLSFHKKMAGSNYTWVVIFRWRGEMLIVPLLAFSLIFVILLNSFVVSRLVSLEQLSFVTFIIASITASKCFLASLVHELHERCGGHSLEAGYY